MIRDKLKFQTVHRTVLNDNKNLIYPMALTPEIIESRIQCMRNAYEATLSDSAIAAVAVAVDVMGAADISIMALGVVGTIAGAAL
jgi:hypothetical protein